MRILVVSNYYYPEHIGGIEVVSYNLVKYYRIFGHSVRWMAADVQPRLRNLQVDDVPIKAWNITEEKFGFPHPLPSLSLIPKIWNSLRWCDVLHLQDSLYSVNMLAFLFAKLLRKPILITQYAKIIPYEQLYKRILQRLAYGTIGKIMFTCADQLVFITENVRAGMAYLTPNVKHDVVPLGVDTEIYIPLSPEERNDKRMKLTSGLDVPIILFVGRLVERKGIHLIRPLIEKHQEWFWVFVGRPDDFVPDEWQLPNLIHMQDVSEDELSKLFASADILLHPSVGEGVTLTVFNSLACGTPVVISEESLSELDIESRKLFFSVLPETKDIENKISQALADPIKLQKIGDLCRDFAVKRLSWQRMCEKYFGILNGFFG